MSPGKILCTAAVIVWLVMLAGSPAAAYELLLNGGFETGNIGPWYFNSILTSGPVWDVVTTDPHSGNYCAHTSYTILWLRQDFTPTSTSQITSVIFWEKGILVTSLGIDYFYSDGGTNHVQVNTTQPPNTWGRYNVTSGLQPGLILTGLKIQGLSPAGTGTIWLDDASIQSNTPPPVLDVALSPVAWIPPTLPPEGSFQFWAVVVNHGPTQAPFRVWARIKYPDGTYTAPTLGPITINPPVGQTQSRLRAQTIPGSWPLGQYQLVGYANWTYAYPAVDSSALTFEKLAYAGGPVQGDIRCTGEPFPGEETMVQQPIAFNFTKVSPNPFNAVTVISFELQAAGTVKLAVYDTAGRLVTTLVDGWREAGSHQVTFDSSNLTSGMYLYRLEAGKNQAQGKIVLLK